MNDLQYKSFEIQKKLYLLTALIYTVLHINDGYKQVVVFLLLYRFSPPYQTQLSDRMMFKLLLVASVLSISHTTDFWERLRLPDVHIPYYFNNNLDIKQLCDKDADCPYKASLLLLLIIFAKISKTGIRPIGN